MSMRYPGRGNRMTLTRNEKASVAVKMRISRFVAELIVLPLRLNEKYLQSKHKNVFQHRPIGFPSQN